MTHPKDEARARVRAALDALTAAVEDHARADAAVTIYAADDSPAHLRRYAEAAAEEAAQRRLRGASEAALWALLEGYGLVEATPVERHDLLPPRTVIPPTLAWDDRTHLDDLEAERRDAAMADGRTG